MESRWGIGESGDVDQCMRVVWYLWTRQVDQRSDDVRYFMTSIVLQRALWCLSIFYLSH